MTFFNLKSSHTMSLIIGLALVIALFTNTNFPQYGALISYLAMGVVLAIPIGLWINAKVQGPSYPHIEHTIYDPVSHIAYPVKDFFIEVEPEPGAAVPEVWPARVGGSKKNGTGREEREEQPVYVFGRWWYPYLVRTKWAVNGIADFKDVSLHIFVFPRPWKEFLGFGARREAAFVLGELIDHGASTHLDSILTPFKVDYLGIEIPIFLGVLSTYTIQQVTRGWSEDIKELARALANMNEVIEHNKHRIFPEKDLQEMVKELFPGVEIPEVKKR
jgi:hypothetical protein